MRVAQRFGRLAAALSAAALIAAGTVPANAAEQEAQAAAAADSAMMAAQDAASAAAALPRTQRGRPKDPMQLADRKLAMAAAEHVGDYQATSATPEFEEWRRELEGGLGKTPLAALSAALAARSGLPAEVMHALARDWLVARVGGYDLAEDGVLAAIRPAFFAQVLHDVAAARHAPFAIEIAARALDMASNCEDAVFADLQNAAHDKALASWAISRGSACTSLGKTALASPERRTTALLRLLESREIQGVDAIPLETWLLGPESLTRVDPADAAMLRHWLERRLIGDLLASGMEEEAIARFDALDARGKAAVLLRENAAFAVRVDGAGLQFDADEASPRVDLAAALAQAGRRADAAALLDDDAQLAASRGLIDCLYAKAAEPAARPPQKDICGLGNQVRDSIIEDGVAAGYVREAIAPTGADLYPLVELAQAYRPSDENSAAMVRLRCRLLTEAQYAPICRNARRSIADRLTPPSQRKDYDIAERRANLGAVAAAGLPGWGALAARTEARLAELKAAFTDGAPDKPETAWSDRPPVEPDPSAFPEKPLPEAMRSPANAKSKAPAWPKGWARLPEGFDTVRTGQSGATTVAVSVSGRFNPGGEVGRGGYWVHVSRDGGRTWQAPLFTGLAAQFPYVVPETSRLPLLDGETLTLEVAVALLDTRSITYPPVGLRTRRTARDLYLEIPLAALARDSNGDGLTDLAAHHLLLDAAPPLVPFVVGSDTASCAAGPGPTQQLRAMFLKRLLGGRQEEALLEPIDRPADAQPMFGWAKAPNAAPGPLFIKGDPADFACMHLPFPALVYGAAGEEALQRKSPDFRLLEAPPIIMNRAGTRGYVVWSLGWTGGTTLFVHGADGWRMEEISSWIT